MWKMLSCFTEMFSAVKNGIIGDGQQANQNTQQTIIRFGPQNQHIYLNPNEHTHTLIWLHGLGDSAEGYLDVFQSKTSPIHSKTKVVLLTAPISKVTINLGMAMTSWFDFKSQDISAENFQNNIGINEIFSNSNFISEIIQQEIKILNGKSENLFIGGFSQGGCMALHNGLQCEQKLGGIMICSGFGFPITKQTKSNSETPILIQHGTNDVLIPLNKSQQSYDYIDKIQHKVKINIFKGLDHGFSEESWQMLKEFYEKYSQAQQQKEQIIQE